MLAGREEGVALLAGRCKNCGHANCEINVTFKFFSALYNIKYKVLFY